MTLTYVQTHPLISWGRKKERQWEHSSLLFRMARLTAKDSAFNPLRPLPQTGREPMLHGVSMEDETDVFMPLTDRPVHTVVVARTRHGKARLADLLKRTYVEAKKAGRKMIIIHLGYPELSARYNSIGSFSRITEPAS